MYTRSSGEITIRFSDLLAEIKSNREEEIARAGNNFLKLSLISRKDTVLMYNHSDWKIVTRDVNEEIVHVIEVFQYFFWINSKDFTELAESANTLTVQSNHLPA